jgi:hypothetical protein
MKWLAIGAGIGVGIALVVAGTFLYFDRVANPRVAREIAEDPDGERARKVMLLTLPSGRRVPVNYLREGDRVYAGADGRWWKELLGDGHRVTVLLRGETLVGTARAVRDDPEHTKDVFSRLRPTAVPGFGTLVEIRLDAGEPAAGG